MPAASLVQRGQDLGFRCGGQHGGEVGVEFLPEDGAGAQQADRRRAQQGEAAREERTGAPRRADLVQSGRL